jgi:hypothetical protein
MNAAATATQPHSRTTHQAMASLTPTAGHPPRHPGASMAGNKTVGNSGHSHTANCELHIKQWSSHIASTASTASTATQPRPTATPSNGVPSEPDTHCLTPAQTPGSPSTSTQPLRTPHPAMEQQPHSHTATQPPPTAHQAAATQPHSHTATANSHTKQQPHRHQVATAWHPLSDTRPDTREPEHPGRVLIDRPRG